LAMSDEPEVADDGCCVVEAFDETMRVRSPYSVWCPWFKAVDYSDVSISGGPVQAGAGCAPMSAKMFVRCVPRPAYLKQNCLSRLST